MPVDGFTLLDQDASSHTDFLGSLSSPSFLLMDFLRLALLFEEPCPLASGWLPNQIA